MVAALEEDQLFKAPEIKDALLRIKRGEFIPVENLDEAYFDRPMRTDLGFNISYPFWSFRTWEVLKLNLLFSENGNRNLFPIYSEFFSEK